MCFAFTKRLWYIPLHLSLSHSRQSLYLNYELHLPCIHIIVAMCLSRMSQIVDYWKYKLSDKTEINTDPSTDSCYTALY